jgi:apolipoprotein N-acyltransferase
LAGCGAWLALPKTGPKAAALGLLACLAAYGLWAVNQAVPNDGEFTAGLVQGDVDQAVKWDKSYQSETVNGYLALSQRTMAGQPDIIFWPETAMPLNLQTPGELVSRIMAFVGRNNVPLVTGGPGLAWDRDRELVYNRAFLLTPGLVAPAYDKEHLVPFGEYAPFGQDIPILEGLLQGVGAFTPGVMVAPVRTGRLAMGMLICYESIFPELAQKRVQDGANVLINLSNDAWFGRSAAPRQHLDLAALRAVEQGRYLVRCTNTGISAVIDPRGRITNQTPLFQEAALTVSHVGLIAETTVYHALHPWLAGLCALAAAAIIFLTRRKNKGIDKAE